MIDLERIAGDRIAGSLDPDPLRSHSSESAFLSGLGAAHGLGRVRQALLDE
jgi:hypothetical protein